MTKLTENRFIGERMSPALVSYLKRVAEPRPEPKIMTILKGK